MEHVSHSKIRKIFNNIVSSLSIIGSIWIGILMLVIVADVIARGMFDAPIQGIPEIVKNSIVGLTFLQLAHVLREGRHIRTTVIYDRANSYMKKVLDLGTNLIGLIIFALLFIAILEPAIQAFQLKTFEGNAVRIPTFPTYFLILLGSFFMVLQYIVNIYDLFSNSNVQNLGKED